MDGDGFGDNDLAACACSEAQAKIAMKAYLDTQYGFDTFNIVNGKLLPEGFAGSWGLDFQGANPARNGSLETGRSLRSGALLRVSGYGTSLEYQTSLGRNQELKFDLKTELSGNILLGRCLRKWWLHSAVVSHSRSELDD